MHININFCLGGQVVWGDLSENTTFLSETQITRVIQAYNVGIIRRGRKK